MQQNLDNMSIPACPLVYPLVLLGGGHSHALLLTYWQKLNPSKRHNVRPLLVSDNTNSPYSGMLPGLLTEEYSFDDCHIDLVNLCNTSDCDFLQGSCINIQKVDSNDYPTLYRLDLKLPQVDSHSNANNTDSVTSILCQRLSINIGSQPKVSQAVSTQNNPALASSQWKVKPISQFYANWQSLKSFLALQARQTDDVSQTNAEKLNTVIQVVGAGAAGVEIACAIKSSQPNCHVQLIARANLPLPSFNQKTQQRCIQQLKKLGIEFVNNQISHDNETLATDHTFTLWCTQSAAPLWLKNTALVLSESGFICVDQHLHSSLPGVFAAGDCAHFSPHPLPKAGVYAVRQAETLFENLLACLPLNKQTVNNTQVLNNNTCLTGHTPARLKPFKPQNHVLAIINMGNQFALAQKGRWSAQGFWPWLYKRKVDQSFMSKFK